MLIVTVGPSARLTDNLRLMPMRSKQTNTKIDRFSFMFRECCCSDGRNPVGRLLSGHATKYYIGGRAASILTQDTVARASPPVIIRRLSTTYATRAGR